MSLLGLRARYYRLYADERPYGCDEHDFHFVEQEMEIPADAAALVLVDLWSKHYCTSWTERAMGILRERIVPIIAAARDAGLVVMHAPSQRLAEKYPQSSLHFEPGDEEVYPRYAQYDGEWPPREFASRMGEYSAFMMRAQPPAEFWQAEYADQRIAQPAEPLPQDFVVRSGKQMHRILKHLGILHLFYAGFATNMCLQHRDYGIKAMTERGYNVILIRDCTTAVESHDTVRSLASTAVFVREIEMKYAFSVESSEFIDACRQSCE